MMDIFDLSIEEFEKKVDEILGNVSEEELMRKLTENGLEVDIYSNDGEFYYIENFNNIWVHNDRTSRRNLIANILIRRKNKEQKQYTKENTNLTEAA